MMKVSVVLSEFFRGHLEDRGLRAAIAKATGIERHTVASLLNNSAKSIKLETIAKLSDYLVRKRGVDPSLLPGSLFARDPEHFWDMLARCQQLDFCVGKRIAPNWPGSEYVMDSDARLQGVISSTVARYQADGGPGKNRDRSAQRDLGHGHIPQLHMVKAPPRKVGPNMTERVLREWTAAQEESETLYARPRPEDVSQAWIAVGSLKVCPVVEVILANGFSGSAFAPEDNVTDPKQRHCPIFFRYRDDDPCPPSCCGGWRLAKKGKSEKPGLYYETENGKWKCCQWDQPSHDAAFVFYMYHRHLGQADVACGGFSSRATNCLTEELDYIVSALGAPQYESNTLHVGMYIIEFTFDPKNKNYDRYRDARPFKTNVIRLPDNVLRRRLEPRSTV